MCILAALLPFASGAQAPRPPGALGGDGSRQNPFLMPPGYRGSSGDERGLELHRRIPGFAGIYFDREHQRRVVRIKRGQPFPEPADARKAISEVMGTPEALLDSVAFEEADRDFAELIAFKDRISNSWVAGEMTGMGINERAGRVTVSVRDAKNMGETQAMLKRLAVPADVVEIVEMPMFQQLRERVRKDIEPNPQ